ncbi:hypothetical protein K3495_g5753 [Podosphaera aphanis]|nr:hypothetical protein K3495_g5753 [Podosphaera aphanis]
MEDEEEELTNSNDGTLQLDEKDEISTRTSTLTLVEDEKGSKSLESCFSDRSSDFTN